MVHVNEEAVFGCTSILESSSSGSVMNPPSPMMF